MDDKHQGNMIKMWRLHLWIIWVFLRAFGFEVAYGRMHGRDAERH